MTSISPLNFQQKSFFKVNSIPSDSKEFADCNSAYIHSCYFPNSSSLIFGELISENPCKNLFIRIVLNSTVPVGVIKLSMAHRKFLNNAPTESKIEIIFHEKILANIALVKELTLSLLLQPPPGEGEKIILSTEKVSAIFKKMFAGEILYKELDLFIDLTHLQDGILHQNKPNKSRTLRLRIEKLQGEEYRALLKENSDLSIKLSSEKDFLILREMNQSILNKIHLNFSNMGIGGLDEQLQEIIQGAFYSRMLTPDAIKKYGLKHAKGILLYGPPGSGKTLIARTIANMFPRKQVKIVNGPQLLDKFVGESEKNLRNVFAEAEQEWACKGEDSDLHIIIFDEIDALFKQRGRTLGGGSDVKDSLVTQILTQLDGINSAQNVLLIGMTNRKDLLDTALLRPGRIGIHIEIGLPGSNGRKEIFEIYTKQLCENGLLAPTIKLEEWVERTVNFTGADIQGLIHGAICQAAGRNFIAKDGAQLAIKDLNKEALAPITEMDFENAFEKMTPSFGVNRSKLEAYRKKRFTPYKSVQETIALLHEEMRPLQLGKDLPTRSILITGNRGVGKTSLAIHFAYLSEAPFITLITSGELVGMLEKDRIEMIIGEFKKSLHSKYSVIVLDDVDGIIRATPDGRNYSIDIAALLVSLLKDPIYKNLLVIGTTPYPNILDNVGLLSSFTEYSLDEIKTPQEIALITKEELGHPLEDDSLVLLQDLPISIKKLLEKLQNFSIA